MWIVYCDNLSAFFICQRSCGISVLLCRNVWCSMKKRTLNTLLNTLTKKRRIGIAKKKTPTPICLRLRTYKCLFFIHGIVPVNDICLRLVCHLSMFHVTLFRCYLVRQWAAVSSHWSLIRLPPQKWKPWLVWRDTCHGQRFRAASVPPTIKGPGMGPLSPSNPPMCSGTVNFIVALNFILALNFSTI